jgi:dipeptidyl-peptidase-4
MMLSYVPFYKRGLRWCFGRARWMLRGAMRMLCASLLLLASCSTIPSAPPPACPSPAAVVADEQAPLLPVEASKVGFAEMAKFPEPGWQIPRSMAFSPDETRFTYLFSESGSDEMSLFSVDLSTGQRQVLLRASQLQGPREKSLAQELRDERQRKRIKGITQYQWAAKKDVLLVPLGGELYLANTNGETTALREGGAEAIDPKLCADGSKVAYAVGSELALLDVASKRETLLTSGAPAGVTRGQSDFNAQEEFDEPSGHFFSPDCKKLVYLEVDEREVAEVPVLGHRKGKPSLQLQKYPETGKANPKVSLHVVDLATKRSSKIPLPEGERYLGRLQFLDAQSFVLSALSRSQRKRQILRVDLNPKIEVRTIHSREVTAGWLPLADLAVSSDAKQIFTVDEQGGHDHLFALDPNGKAVPAQLTRGDFDVTELLGTSSIDAKVYITSTEGEPIGRPVFEVDGRTGVSKRLSKGTGTNVAVFSKSGANLALVHSSRTQPPSAELRVGERVLPIEIPVDPAIAELALRTFEPFVVDRPGLPILHGTLLAPRTIEPGKKYPLVVMVYGGPGVQTVMDRWSPRLHWQHLADRGFFVMQVDNRGSSGRGPAFEQAIDRKLGEVELADQFAALEQVLGTHPIDPQRVAIYGHSYGGFLAAHALLREGSPFTIGIAGSPVTDWRLYDTAYTERYMGTPQENEAGYQRATLAANVDKLRGKLLIVHALMDENVHFQNTADLVDALVKAQKPFEMFVYPGERHGYRSTDARRYAFELVTRKLAETLGPSAVNAGH